MYLIYMYMIKMHPGKGRLYIGYKQLLIFCPVVSLIHEMHVV